MANAILAPSEGQYQDDNTPNNIEKYQRLIPLLKFVTVAVLVLNSAFNVLYGFSQGVGEGQWLIAMCYGMGDLALVCLMLFPVKSKITKVLGTLAVCGLFSLSIFSAAGYLISQQYTKDNFDVALQKRNVEILQNVYDQHHQLQTGQRLEKETSQLRQMIHERGGDSSTAIYHAIARVTGHTTEGVTLGVRLGWAVVFVVTGIALTRLLGEYVGTYLAAPQQRAVQARRGPRSPTRDTQTQGDSSTRYREIRERVRGGQLKPSVRSLAKEGMTNRTAVKYLQAMAQDGVITKNGQGYHLG